MTVVHRTLPRNILGLGTGEKHAAQFRFKLISLGPNTVRESEIWTQYQQKTTKRAFSCFLMNTKYRKYNSLSEREHLKKKQINDTNLSLLY